MAGYDNSGIKRHWSEYREHYCHNVWWWYLPGVLKPFGRFIHWIGRKVGR